MCCLVPIAYCLLSIPYIYTYCLLPIVHCSGSRGAGPAPRIRNSAGFRSADKWRRQEALICTVWVYETWSRVVMHFHDGLFLKVSCLSAIMHFSRMRAHN